MAKSITRKFLVKKLPPLEDIEQETYKRFYLYNKDSIVIRIQQVNDRFELERKENENDLVRDGATLTITADEYNSLKNFANERIERDSFTIQKSNPRIVLRVYRGKFEGLNRAEVNFESDEQAAAFQPLSWFDREITGSPLSQDGYLLELTDEDFKKLLA